MYQGQQQSGQWITMNQLPKMSAGYSQQLLGVPNGLLFQGTALAPNERRSSQRKRPGTAGRKAQLSLKKKMGLYAVPTQASVQHVPMSAKAANQIDVEIHRLRPRKIFQERERLYDDVIKHKIVKNNLADENTRLKTRI